MEAVHADSGLGTAACGQADQTRQKHGDGNESGVVDRTGYHGCLHWLTGSSGVVDGESLEADCFDRCAGDHKSVVLAERQNAIRDHR
jgi:hypothetical protein